MEKTTHIIKHLKNIIKKEEEEEEEEEKPVIKDIIIYISSKV